MMNTSAGRRPPPNMRNLPNRGSPSPVNSSPVNRLVHKTLESAGAVQFSECKFAQGVKQIFHLFKFV